MADFSGILRAAPIGLLMALGSYVAFRRRRSGFVRARHEYPAIAARLGLEHRTPGDAGRIGALLGIYEGHRVFVDPDDRPRVVLYLEGAPSVLLRSFEHEKRTPADKVRVDTRDPAFDGLFRERFAAATVAEGLVARARDLGEAVRRLERAHSAPYASVSVTSERIECAIDMGRPAHVPVETVTALLPALAHFARILEEIGGSTGSA